MKITEDIHLSLLGQLGDSTKSPCSSKWVTPVFISEWLEPQYAPTAIVHGLRETPDHVAIRMQMDSGPNACQLALSAKEVAQLVTRMDSRHIYMDWTRASARCQYKITAKVYTRSDSALSV